MTVRVGDGGRGETGAISPAARAVQAQSEFIGFLPTDFVLRKIMSAEDAWSITPQPMRDALIADPELKK